MTHEERSNIISIVIGLFILGYFGSRFWAGYHAGDFDGPDGLKIWAWLVLRMVGTGIVAVIVGMIVGHILISIVTNTPRPSFVVDERDRMIGVWGLRTTVVVMSAGFIGMIVLLALGQTAILALNVLLFGSAIGDLCGNVMKAVLYRRGM